MLDRESRNRQRHAFRERNARAAGSRYKYSRFTRVEGPDILESNLSTTDFYVADPFAFLIANKNRNFIQGVTSYMNRFILQSEEKLFSPFYDSYRINVFHVSSFISLPSSPLTDSPIFNSVHCLYICSSYININLLFQTK